LPEPGHIEASIRAASFEPLGWLAGDGSPEAGFDGGTPAAGGQCQACQDVRAVRRCSAIAAHDKMDDWTREVLAPLATQLGAQAVFPFDVPHPPFLRWAKAARAGFTSPLGLNIRADFGLWHAFRAAFIFKDDLTIPACADGAQVPPCETCADKPCLTACPVSAFSGTAYDVAACAGHLGSPQGAPCRSDGCLARLACPIAPGYRYAPGQMRFHMVAFMQARGVDPAQFD
jgi:hypothetical protein